MRLLFGTIVAVVLLGIWIYTVVMACLTATCIAAGPGCTAFTAASFTPSMASTMALSGGLVSALVVAELAITVPGQPPVQRVVASDATPRFVLGVRIVTGLYLVAWLAAGLVAFVVGYLNHPDALKALSDMGQGWLGIAVAAGYSYFALTPKK